jgi:proteasome lid subunit RPN8/RPN11
MLVLSSTQLRQLRMHGERAYPREACGALLGKRTSGARRVHEVVACENVHAEPQHRYRIDPRELIGIQRTTRDRSLEIVGFYHSHPDHPAHWSATDLEEAYWSDCSYVITSVNGGQAGESRSFVLADLGDENTFTEEKIVMETAPEA